VQDRIVVGEPAATGDDELDAALLSLAGGRPPRADIWVGLPRRGIRDAYAGRLVSAGVLRAEPSGILGTRRYRIAAPDSAAAARARLDAVAQSAGPRVDIGQAAFGGLASAIGLGHVLYPGRPGRTLRARLVQTARWDPAVNAATEAAEAHEAVPAATSAAVHAATSAAVNGARSVAAHSADLHLAGLRSGGFYWGGHGDGGQGGGDGGHH
jgi:hypothetical protein